MKKYLFLILAAIFCVPSEGFAQKRNQRIPVDQGASTDPWTVMTHGTSTPLHIVPRPESLITHNRKKYRTEKRYIKVPRTRNLNFAEISTDDATGNYIVRWTDGSEYVGDIHKGTIKGKGSITYSDGGKYLGDWSEGRRWGVGSMHYSNGDTYTGKWVWDLPHGKGTYITAEGIAMTGKFENGIPHGKFIMQAPDGSLYTARWKHGELNVKSIKPLEE